MHFLCILLMELGINDRYYGFRQNLAAISVTSLDHLCNFSHTIFFWTFLYSVKSMSIWTRDAQIVYFGAVDFQKFLMSNSIFFGLTGRWKDCLIKQSSNKQCSKIEKKVQFYLLIYCSFFLLWKVISSNFLNSFGRF